MSLVNGKFDLSAGDMQTFNPNWAGLTLSQTGQTPYTQS
jgi:hypothetical protein